MSASEANLAESEGELQRLGGSKERAELELSYTKITAPFEGIMGLSAADVGALVGPDSGSLVTLTRLDPINVEFPVATAAYLRYRERELPRPHRFRLEVRIVWDGLTGFGRGVAAHFGRG